MDVFYQVFGFVAAVCLGIMILTGFFTAISHYKRSKRGFEVISQKGFVQDGKRLNVHLRSGKSLQGLGFVGFTDQSSGQSGVPFPFLGMIVLETTLGSRVLLRADSVMMLEEID